MEIKTTYTDSLLSRYRDLVEAEWGNVDPFDILRDGIQVPRPILVVSGQDLIGGLSFTWAPKPGAENLGLWINTVFIVKKHRKKGVATSLVKKAISLHQDNFEIFAYTEYPNLYLTSGWEIVWNKHKDYTVHYKK